MAVTYTKQTKMSGQDLLTHTFGKLKIGVVKIAWGTGEVYTTGGVNINGAMSALGIKNVVAIAKTDCTVGLTCYDFIYAYSSGNHILKIYTANNTEMANNTSLANATVTLLVIGY